MSENSNGVVKVSMEEIHETLLKLIIEFDKFCKENQIIYYLMGGSALGAIRHKGFIPWDDDIDVFMTYDNYVKFIEACKCKLNTEKFYFQEGNSKELKLYFSKFRMNNTTFIEKDTINIPNYHQGFYIDVMCLYNASSNTFMRGIQYAAASILKTRALADIGYNRDSVWRKVLLSISKIVVCKPVKKILLYIVNMYKNKSTELVGHFFRESKI